MIGKKLYITFLALGLVFSSCRKDKVERTITPYTPDVPSHFPAMPIPADNPFTVEGVELGRRLFYEEKLSRDNTVSCATCHKQEYSFSDDMQFSQGVDGQFGTRHSMALVNLAWQEDFFWDGRDATLEEQILEPIVTPHEMDQTWEQAINKLKIDPTYNNQFYNAFGVEDYDSTHAAKAMAQFIRTLISGESKYDIMYKYQNNIPLTPSEQAIFNDITFEEWGGFEVFFSLSGGDCLHCHDGALMHVNMFANNGLDASFDDDPGRMLVTGNPNDAGKFKVPTLRNVEHTAPYMHDGRFNTLGDVVNHYSVGVVQSPTIDPLMEFAHQGGVQLDAQQRQLLITFLKTFTDQNFLNNPDFSDPEQ